MFIGQCIIVIVEEWKTNLMSLAILCFSLQNEHQSKPAAPNLQHTTNWEQDDRCGNSRTQSQAHDDGYINVWNMLST